ncbi:hypothetical protein CTRI78_v007561 [Colletotrichum trifolii]|uniref:Inheritance of peroxisomes protein 1 n=1 Tax=Colletotrichum trifolii TaxID=5466 RepID=A0A4R8RAV1_COLTR|nr:hypothetical protein CTRI78_v007561 [Colletotrichum trifolii]
MESLRPDQTVPRRVATSPIPTPIPAPRSVSAGGLVETLYNHPNVKIVAFTATSRGRARSPGRGPADEPGTLSATSQLERTIAIGPFRIYRTGSVAFLNCGSALQPMLPKSQCWALEEDSSKFVLQIRRPNYWRIEIPVTNPTEQELAASFKGVLGQILQFEKTECPFKRSFNVVLPEKPKTPVKKRPWTPPVKRALPVLSTPAHEVSPSHKTLSRSDRRASTSALRGRTEQRRFSVIGTEFQTNSDSRGTSAEATGFLEATHLRRSIVDPPAISEERTKTEESTIDKLNADDSTTRAGDETEVAGPAVEEAAATQSAPALNADNTESIRVEEQDDRPVVLSRTVPSDASGAGQVQPQSDSQCETSYGSSSDDLQNVSRPGVSAEPGNESRPSTAIQVPPAAQPISSEDTRNLEPKDSGLATEATNNEEASSPPIEPAAKPRSTEAWAPKRTRSLTSPVAPQIMEQLITVEVPPVKRSTLEAGTPTPTNIYDVIRNYEKKLAAAGPTPSIAEITPASEPPAEEGNASDSGSGKVSTSSAECDESGEVLEGSGVVGGRRKKLRGFRAGRALVPPQLTLVTSPPSKAAEKQTSVQEDAGNTKDAVSPTGSADSFHSVRSSYSPITPVPRSPASDASPTTFPYPHDNILIPKKTLHYRDISDLTVTPDTRRTWDATSSLTDDSSQESAATAPDVVSEAVEQPDKAALSEDEAASSAMARRPHIRHRATTSISVGHRTLSPLPPPANLFVPTTTTVRRQPFLRSQLEIVRRIPMAIVSKTCEVLLGPPSHLIALMLQVAAKIAAGQWRGMMFGFGEGGETIPVQWDYSDDEYSSWGEDDDYYLSQVESSRANSVIGTDESDERTADGTSDTGRSWEVD